MASNSSSSFFSNLPIKRKLTLIMGVALIPIVVLTIMLHGSRNEQIANTKKEIAGVEYITALRSLAESIPQHRALVNGALNGDLTMRNRAEQLQPSIDRAIGALEAVGNMYDARFGTADRLLQLKRNWQEIKNSSLKAGIRENLEAHNRLMHDVLEYIRVIGERSTLVSDPHLDAYYLMDAAVQQLPVIVDRVSLLGTLVGNASLKKTVEERVPVQILAEQIDSMVQNTQRNMGVAFTDNPGLEPKMNAALATAVRASDTFLRPLKEGNVERFSGLDRASEGANTALSGFFSLYDATLPNLRSLLQTRVDDMEADAYRRLFGVFVVVIAVGLAFGWISSLITKQVRQINNVFTQIGQGNYQVRVPVTSKDELGTMAGSMNAVLDDTLSLIQSREERNRIQTSIQKLLDDISGVAAGDLTQEAEVTAEITGAIADSFNYMISELRQLVSNVNVTTSHVGQSARTVLTTAETLAQGSVSQANQIAEASGSIEAMVRSIREVSTTANTAATVADQTFRKAKQGSEAVQKTIEGMGGIRNQVQETSKRLKGLGERSQEIGSIVQLIGDIADRTSILALNASIQAAMAGEAGRGFAVVAEEVERLAERAAEATKKVNTLIKSIQADTSEAITAMEETTREVVQGSNLANAAGRTLSEIESVSAELSSLIRSISSASEEQALGSENISRSMSEISVHTQETAEGAKQAAASVQQLTELTDELRRSMQRFKLPSEEPHYALR